MRRSCSAGVRAKATMAQTTTAHRAIIAPGITSTSVHMNADRRRNAGRERGTCTPFTDDASALRRAAPWAGLPSRRLGGEHEDMASTATDRDVITEVNAWLEENWDPDLTVAEWWERLGTSGWAAPA